MRGERARIVILKPLFVIVTNRTVDNELLMGDSDQGSRWGEIFEDPSGNVLREERGRRVSRNVSEWR